MSGVSFGGRRLSFHDASMLTHGKHSGRIVDMPKEKCPKGGTHVYPHKGKHYDDGRCLKCGKRKPEDTA